MFDRPGYGASSRLPGRGIAVVADDAAEFLDHLGLDAVHALGRSGGGPHVLAFAARHSDRVRAATVVAGAVPLEEDDLGGLIPANRDCWYAAREGWQAVYDLVAPQREAVLADPLAGIRRVMESAPASDLAVLDDPDFQRVHVENVPEQFRQGAEGWADESMALSLPWDFDPGEVRCSVTWWHGEHDNLSPIAAVRRLVTQMPDVDLRVWPEAGHLESYHRHDEIAGELLARSA
jgi:pimeloyl-ACP methyl ester carboxylesterase